MIKRSQLRSRLMTLVSITICALSLNLQGQITSLPASASDNHLWKYNYIIDPGTGYSLTAIELGGGGKGTYELKLLPFTGEANQAFILKKWEGNKGYSFGSQIDEWLVFTTSRSDYTSDRQYREPGHPIWCYTWMNGGNQFWDISMQQNSNIAIIQNINSQLYLFADKEFVTQNAGHTRWELFSDQAKARERTIAIRSNSVQVNFAEKKQNGALVGHFIQSSAKTWLEKSTVDHPNREWIELTRDEWSVHLKDGIANIQIDLYTKEIYYWENGQINSRIKLYDIGNSTNIRNGYMVTLVEHALIGATRKSGEFSRVGYKLWKEIGVDGTIYEFKENRRDEWSAYLHDAERNVFIVLDLHRKKVMFKLGNDNYKDLYDITSSYGIHDPAQEGIINFPGSNQSVTVGGLENILKKEGFKLVTITTELKEGDCALLFPSTNTEELSAQFGCLVCNARVNNVLSLKFQAVQSKCQGNIGIGTGGECDIALGATEVTLDEGNGNKKTYNVSGPAASACASLSVNRMCADAGVTLGSVKFTDKNGNGVGVCLDAGIGAGFEQDYENGVLTVGFDLKIGLGGTIALSVNLAEIANNPESGLIQLAETGFLVSGGVVTVAAAPLKSLFISTLGEAAVIPNTAISLTTECPFDVAKWIFTQDEIDCLD